jgi:hypothetical protein
MYPAVSRHCAADAVHIMWSEPWLLVRGCAAPVCSSGPPVTSNTSAASVTACCRGNGSTHRRVRRVRAALVNKEHRRRPMLCAPSSISRLVHLIGAVADLHGIASARVAARDEARAGTLTFMVVTIIYLTVVAIGLNVGENQRYRFLLDAFLWVLLASALQSSFRRFTDRR